MKKMAKQQTQKEAKAPKEDSKDLKIKELTELAQHLQADFENFRKRKEKEQQDFTKFASEQVVQKLMPLLDNFEMAFQQAKELLNKIGAPGGALKQLDQDICYGCNSSWDYILPKL